MLSIDESTPEMSEDETEELLREQHKKRKEKEERAQKEKDKIVSAYIKHDKYLMELEKDQAMGTTRARRNWIRAHAFKLANPGTQQSQTQSSSSIRSLSRLVLEELVSIYDCSLIFAKWGA